VSVGSKGLQRELFKKMKAMRTKADRNKAIFKQ